MSFDEVITVGGIPVGSEGAVLAERKARIRHERDARLLSCCHAPIDYARGYYGKPKRKKVRK